MDVTLPADLRNRVEQELASGRYRSRDELIELAVRQFFDERQRGQQRLDALRKIGQAGDHAGLYEGGLPPSQEGQAARSGCWTPAPSPTFPCAIRSCGSRSHHAFSSRNGQSLRVPICEGFRFMPPSWFLRFWTDQACL